jgi:hypothetical protein
MSAARNHRLWYGILTVRMPIAGAPSLFTRLRTWWEISNLHLLNDIQISSFQGFICPALVISFMNPFDSEFWPWHSSKCVDCVLVGAFLLLNEDFRMNRWVWARWAWATRIARVARAWTNDDLSFGWKQRCE